MKNEDEYVSVPKLAVLAKELEMLNAKLISEGLPSSVRILRLRQYAESVQRLATSNAARNPSNNRPECNRPTISITGPEEGPFRYWVGFLERRFGPFKTAHTAREAHRQAHLSHYGERSAYHPQFEASNAHLSKTLATDEFKECVRQTTSDVSLPRYIHLIGTRYRATLYDPNTQKSIYVGQFGTLEEAIEAQNNARLALAASEKLSPTEHEPEEAIA
jgi:hypothetical protein